MRHRTRRRIRAPRSLFWTFAGSFLLVVAGAAALQGWGLAALTAELAAQRAATDASQALSRAVGPLAAAGWAPGDEIHDLVATLDPGDPAFFLVYWRVDGKIHPPWPVDRRLHHRLVHLLETGVDDWIPGEPRDAEPPAEPRRREGRDRPRVRPENRPRDRPRPVALVAPAPESGALRVLERRDVADDDGFYGELVAVYRGRPRGWNGLSGAGDSPLVESLPALLFVPAALLLATGAGLFLFRLLVSRLRRLETLAERIAEGDLDARVDDPRDDEIGRLGARLDRMAASLAEARDRLESSDAQRRRLLADISHELATPLTSIRGYAETLLDPGVPTTAEERADYLAHVLDEARRMDRLISDLFDLARLEADRGASLDLVRLDLAELARNVLARFAPAFEREQITLDAGGLDEPIPIFADGHRMEQVLENLLTNALRYVPAGGAVEVRLERRPGSVRLRVADDGPGIPEADLPHVFDRFYRSEVTRDLPGSGLGLAIVKEIVERHGGRLAAANRSSGSAVPTGAVLTIELPAPAD